ncbi:MAG: FHA domain-containing protein [Bdellovibrionales bacterium]|nr:FHA domain-containing protein [Bdellovibrionales bacterium]
MGEDQKLAIKVHGDKKTYILESGVSVKVGRSNNCDIVISDPHVSREHFQIDFYGAKAIVKDLGSRRGVMLLGERLKTQEIRKDFTLSIGELSISCFFISDEVTKTAQYIEELTKTAVKIRSNKKDSA